MNASKCQHTDRPAHSHGKCRGCADAARRAGKPRSKPLSPVDAYAVQSAKSGDRAHVKALVEQLREAKARQGFLDAIASDRGTPKVLPRETPSGVREMTGVVLASDWHVEERVLPESVAYRNEYDLSIADKRIARFFSSIIWHYEHHRASGFLAIRDLVLWLGGDLMTGFIHEELAEGNQLSPSQTILWLLPRLRDGIHTLLETLGLETITVPCSYGNHGRTTPKPRISSGFCNSFEWLMYHQLAAMFANEPRVAFEITNSPHQYVEVYGYTLHFHHGDSLKYQGGVGGLSIPFLKAIPQWDSVRHADYHHIGHFHQCTTFGDRAIVNGSLIGFGPYSQHIRAPFELPAQQIYFVDSKRGRCLPGKLWVGDSGKIQGVAA